jgi:hypothetical protein
VQEDRHPKRHFIEAQDIIEEATGGQCVKEVLCQVRPNITEQQVN